MILLTINKGIVGLAIGLVISSFAALLLSLILSGKVVGYTLWNMINDCMPYFILSSVLCIAAYFLTLNIENNLLHFGSCILFVGILYATICRLFKLEEMMEVTGWMLKIIRMNKSKNT